MGDLKMGDRLQEILMEKFGLVPFQPNQLQIIERSINNENIYACMPTGSGKSLCFLFETFMSGKILIVIQPLLALLLDFSQHHPFFKLDMSGI